MSIYIDPNMIPLLTFLTGTLFGYSIVWIIMDERMRSTRIMYNTFHSRSKQFERFLKSDYNKRKGKK